MSKRKGRGQPRTSEIKSVMRAPREAEAEAEAESRGPESGMEPNVTTPTSNETDREAADGIETHGATDVHDADSASSDRGGRSAELHEHDEAPRLRAVAPLGLDDTGAAGDVYSSTDSLDRDGSLADDDEAETTLPLPLDVESDETEAFLSGLLEALLFTSQKPLALKDIARSAGIDRPRAKELLDRLIEAYRPRGLSIEEVAGGFVMRSSARYAPYIQKVLALRPVRLSRAQLETLAIIAYRQPVTKPEVDDIRGVDSGQVIKGLLERALLKILGKKDEPGRPMLYGTTNDFLELLNLQSLKDLPTLREYTELSEESQRKFSEETGEAAPHGALELGAADDPHELDRDAMARSPSDADSTADSTDAGHRHGGGADEPAMQDELDYDDVEPTKADPSRMAAEPPDALEMERSTATSDDEHPPEDEEEDDDESDDDDDESDDDDDDESDDDDDDKEKDDDS